MRLTHPAWLRVLLLVGLLGYSAGYGWLRWKGGPEFVADPFCIFLLAVALAVSFRSTYWSTLLGVLAIIVDVGVSLVLLGPSQPTLVVVPTIILVSILLLGRKTGALVGATVAAMIPLAFALSGQLGYGPGFDVATVHTVIVVEFVILATVVTVATRMATFERANADDRLFNLQRFEMLVETMPDGIILVSPDGRIEEFNPAAETLTGVPRVQILNCEVGGGECDVPHEILDLASRMEAGEVVLEGRHIEVTPAAADWDQASGRVLIVLRDVSERHQLAEQATNIQRQVARSQKLEAVGRLAAGVAHDFNNILSVVSGYIGLRESDAPPDDPVFEMKEAVEVGTKLVRQLLVFSKEDLAHQRPIDVAKLVNRIKPIVARLVGEQVELVITTDLQCPIVGDYSKVEQVIFNLAANARDAMPSGGKLTISCRLIDDTVQLAIEDSGTGIPKDAVDNIFDAFFTTKDSAHGTGLGLATVHSIVTESKGTIDVETGPGGTTFTIRWPTVDEEMSAEINRQTFLPPIHLRQKRVLLVDDNRAARALLARYLQKNGFVVVSAESGDAVLSDPDILAHPPDILVTDLVMPGLSGIELVTELKNRWGPFPYLLMSGYTAETLANEPSETISHLLEKPFQPSTLVERIAEVLRGS